MSPTAGSYDAADSAASRTASAARWPASSIADATTAVSRMYVLYCRRASAYAP